MRIVYMHGFASSPQSNKAQFFGRKFAEAGVPFVAPQLDGGDFRGLTITGQLAVIEKAVDQDAGDGPVTLMGSSLGGYLAGLYAARHPEQVERLVLLAPAFHFMERWRSRFSAEALEHWKREGSIPIYHYGTKQDEPLGYQLIEDALLYEAEPDFHQPALILHGSADPVVPVEGSETFAVKHPGTRVKVFQAGHELTEVLDELWTETASLLGLDKRPA